MCKIIETNRAFSEIYQSHTERPLGSGIGVSDLPRLIHEEPGDLTTERIYTIICRWYGLRVLQDLYLDPSVAKQYSESIFPSLEEIGDMDTIQLSDNSVSISHLQKLSVGDRAKETFDAQATGRFHRALTSYWLAMESHWLLCRSDHETWEELWKLSDSVEDIWYGEGLLERLEALEAYDFVYGFLLRGIFPSIETTLPWLSGRRDSIYFNNDTFTSCDWSFFIQSCKLFLAPPDIIELLAMECSSSKTRWRVNKSEYLQWHGAFDTSEGTALTEHPDGATLDFWFNEVQLEEGVCQQIRIHAPVGNDHQVRARWKEYRDAWNQQARGKLFRWTGSLDDILTRILNPGGGSQAELADVRCDAVRPLPEM